MKTPQKTLTNLVATLAGSAFLVVGPNADAAAFTWNDTTPGGALWETGANWLGVGSPPPIAGGTANIGNGGLARVTSISAAAGAVFVGQNAVGGTNSGLKIEAASVLTAGTMQLGSVKNAGGYVDVYGSLVTTGPLTVGRLGKGLLTIYTGGSVTTGGAATIGDPNNDDNTAEGTVYVSGSWNTAALTVGNLSKGGLEINGGRVTSSGAAAVGNSRTGSRVGDGSVKITNGSWVMDSTLTIGNVGTGKVEVGTGGVLTAASSVLLGSAAAGSGTLAITGSANLGSTTVGNNGAGYLEVKSQGVLVSAGATIGANSTGSGTASFSGSSRWISTNSLLVGSGGTGTLNLTDGATLSQERSIIIGGGVNSYGEVNITGASLTNSVGTAANGRIILGNASGATGIMNVGAQGSVSILENISVATVHSGTVNIAAGGTVTNGGAGVLADSLGAHGTVTVSGSWTMGTNINIGNKGVGVLNVESGGVVNTTTTASLGVAEGADGTANIRGGTWTIGSALTVGNVGSGVLNISHGGVITATTLTLANNALSPKAIVTIGGAVGDLGPDTATAAGVLNVSEIKTGAGAGGVSKLNFNHTSSSYQFQTSSGTDVKISGNLKVNAYAGTTIIAGITNTYSGGTQVYGGTLLVNNAAGTSGLGTGAVTVTGGILGGSGKVSGEIFLRSGGTLAPGGSSGGVGHFTAGNLTWDGGGKMAFNLGSTAVASDTLSLAAFNKGTTGLWIFDFQDGADAPAVGITYTLLTFSSASGGWTSGDFGFTYGTPGSLEGVFALNANNLQFTVTQLVPEPHGIALALLGGAALARSAWNSRRRKTN